MRKRIKYRKALDMLVSNILTNYEGKQLYVIISKNGSVYILNNNTILESFVCHDQTKSKRLARTLLIHKYNVRLGEEIRPK